MNRVTYSNKVETRAAEYKWSKCSMDAELSPEDDTCQWQIVMMRPLPISERLSERTREVDINS